MSVLSSLLLSVAVLATPAPLAAQAVVQPLPGTTDADRLGEQMRALAANPNDVNALITAGELSLKLDDLSAAASLFARAEKSRSAQRPTEGRRGVGSGPLRTTRRSASLFRAGAGDGGSIPRASRATAASPTI